ncbi:ChbG/HpnK family deacetylase [Roseateles sp. YR242]|uniref:ChbG/HpnK family deacetylase n=1 Tax=Roseateles sp. YR242 TaxID=1855305 RepID=UPI0015A5E44F|nr:ChbG/HpnK family deacetylase [Roseateles sp. YR242]
MNEEASSSPDQHGGAPTRLCVCADAFGLHPSVNDAVLQLVAQGRLQATSAMVGAPAWLPGAAALKALEPE